MSEAAYLRRTRRRGGGSAISTSTPTSAILVPLLAVVVAGVLIYLLTVLVLLPNTRITRIYVHADFDITREQLLAAAGFGEREYFFALRMDELAAGITGIPVVRTARVERVFPNAVRFTMERRRPLAVVLAVRDGRPIPAVVDDQGVIFEHAADLVDLDLPVITGIELQGSLVGARLPEMMTGFLESLYRLRVDAPRLYGRISEFRVVPRRSGGYDVLMYFSEYRVPVRLENRITPELATWSLMVLDVLAQQRVDGDVAEVDVRSGEIVYRLKEDADGR